MTSRQSHQLLFVLWLPALVVTFLSWPVVLVAGFYVGRRRPKRRKKARAEGDTSTQRCHPVTVNP